MTTKIQVQIASETEKALKVSVRYNHLASGKLNTFSTWLPKSQASIIDEKIGDFTFANIPSWLADKIANEIRATTGMTRNMGANGILYNF